MSGERKTFKIEDPDALRALDEWVAIADQSRRLHESYQREFQEKVRALTESSNLRLQALWSRIAASVGINPEDTWASTDWGMDLQFFRDHGDAYVFWRPNQQDPFSQMVSGQDISAPTDRNKLN